MNNGRVAKTVYHLLPDKYTDKVEKEAKYARISNYEQTTFQIISFSAMLSVLFITLFLQNTTYRIAAAAILTPIIFALPYVVVSLYANNRKNEIEQTLPVALNLISSNMKSGLTVDKSFLLSARDEFGPLATDLKNTAMDMFGGTPVSEALTNLAESTNSELFKQTLTLLKDGIETGGTVSQLLEASAKDVQKSLRLRKEIAANVKMYSMFIIIASVIGAPLLFSVSVHLTEETASMWEDDTIDFEDLPATRGGFTPEQPSFRPEFFENFALAALIISNISASFLISVIKKGHFKDGIKYAPVYTFSAVGIFYLTNYVIGLVL